MMTNPTDLAMAKILDSASSEGRMMQLKETATLLMGAVHYLSERLETATGLSHEVLVTQLQEDLEADGFIAEDFCIHCYLGDISEWCFAADAIQVSPNSII